MHNILYKTWKRNTLNIFFFFLILILGFSVGKAFASNPETKVKAIYDRSVEVERARLGVAASLKNEAAVAPKPLPKKEAPSTTTAPNNSAATSPTVPHNLPAGSHTDWMREAGIPEENWGYVEYIIAHESGWLPSNVNSTGCIGLGQNCPSNGKYFLVEACPNWQTDPVCQLRRWDHYATKYGGWQGSYNHWLAARSW